MSQKISRGLTRAGSDGVIKTTSVVKPLQRLHSSTESPRKNMPAPAIKNLTNVLKNGSHSAMNGGSHERASVKKSPLLPPAHPRDRKSNSSDSSLSSSNSSGSVFRAAELAAQSSNRDGQLSNSPSNQPKSSGKPHRNVHPYTVQLYSISAIFLCM